MSSSPSNTVGKRTNKLHPDFRFDDADITLLSADGTLFHVHACILRMVSTVFKDMFAVKHIEGDCPVTLAESNEVLRTLFAFIYPTHGAPSKVPISHFSDVANAADKYNITIVSNSLKQILLDKYPFTTLFSDRSQASDTQIFPLERYIVAYDLGWLTVAEDLSAKTLSCDLNSEIALDLLFRGNSQAARPLLSLHRQRRAWLYNAFSALFFADDSNPCDTMGTKEEQTACVNFVKASKRLNTQHIARCPNSVFPQIPSAWWKVKAKIHTMLDTDASGDQLLEMKFFQSSEVRELLIPPCCKDLNLHNESILREHLQYIVDRVPKTNKTFQEAMKFRPKPYIPR